jgi:hypothetical protein
MPYLKGTGLRRHYWERCSICSPTTSKWVRNLVPFRNSQTSIFAVEIAFQTRHRNPPTSSDMDGRAELSRATQAVEGVRVETDAPGSFWNRNEIRGGLLRTDLVEPWV